jgi:hypothetical protein
MPHSFVHGQHIQLGLGSVLDGPGQIGRPVGAGLEEDPLGPGLAQLLDPIHERLLLDHAQPGVALELLEAALLEGLDDVGILGVGQDDVAAALQLLGLLEALDLDFAADVLGPLTPLKLDGLDAQLVDGVFLHLQAGVLDVGLDDDVAVAVRPVLEALDPHFHVGRAQDAPVLDLGLLVHGADVLAHGQDAAADGRADGQALPVVLGHVGRAHAGDDERELQLDVLVAADGRLGGDLLEGRLVRVGLAAVGPGRRAHDREVGQVVGVVLLRPGRDDAEGLGIEDLGAAVGGLADLAHPDAAVHTSDAHAAEGGNRPFGAVLGQCRRASIEFRERHAHYLLKFDVSFSFP